jgi:two-component system, sensor histidine kinase and response regulator
MPTLLLVEDDETNQLMYKMLFKTLNITVLLAKDGEEAIEMALSHNDISLVLMDLQIPKIDGIAATAQIRNIHPHLPIVALTANVVKEVHQAALEAGCCDVLLKPYRCKELTEYVNTFFENAT